jgi:Fur family ferric uptake transcriptional regulator
VTPQRRAILGAFQGDAGHLSADEVHARAAALIPELGRGTVYATLAELTELGILSAHGTPEPTRYEANTGYHQHFRCRLCQRLFDAVVPDPDTGALAADGFAVEEITVVATGVCAECGDYDRGLRAAATRARETPTPALPAGLAATGVDTPVGRLAVGATPEGVVRVVFENHADAEALEDARRSRRGGRAAREHLTDAKAALSDYQAGRPPGDCTIDWAYVPGERTLRATRSIPRGGEESYERLDTDVDAHERGRLLGANPVVILLPCHRVTRGREVPGEYVGGPEQRHALRAFEQLEP